MLYHIRRELGKAVIENRGAEEVGVNRDQIACDVIAFEETLDRGDETDALDLYRGDLLGSFYIPDAAPKFTQWLDRERERLRLRAAEGAWHLADTAEQTGDLDAARTWAKHAAGLVPFSDEAQIRLITLLKRIGDRSEALDAYHTFTQRLRTEWDMEPTDELKALVDTMTTDGIGLLICTGALNVRTTDPAPRRGLHAPIHHRRR